MSANNNNAAAAAATEAKAPGDTKKEEKKEIVMVNIKAEDFELENYINNYTGHTKIARLFKFF